MKKSDLSEILPGDNYADASYKIQQAAMHIKRLEQEIVDLKNRIKSLDQAVLEEIDNRDKTEEHADRLSYEIGRALGVDVGEHSSANCPWNEAFFAIQDFDIQDCKTQAVENFKKELLAYVGSTMDSDMHAMLLGVLKCFEVSPITKGDNNVSD